jgi:hypothetical protein
MLVMSLALRYTPRYVSFKPSGFAVPHRRVVDGAGIFVLVLDAGSSDIFNIIQTTAWYNNDRRGQPGEPMWWWRTLAVNVTLLVVSSVLVADVKMSEEMMVLVLTGLCVILF